VGDDDPAGREVRRDLRKACAYVLVRQAVETVPAHAGLGEFPRDGEHLGERRLAAMKGRVEAGHLRQLGRDLGDGGYGREVVRLVQRRQRLQLCERSQHFGVHEDRSSVAGSAVDDTVSDGGRARAEQFDDCLHEHLGRRPVVEALHRPAPFGDSLALVVHDLEPGRDADLLDLPLEHQALGPVVERKLDARRTGIEDGDGSAHGPAFLTGSPQPASPGATPPAGARRRRTRAASTGRRPG
jgi:hypothetical protein